MDKKYYLELAEKWFDAATTEDEELDLRLYLAGTEDPDFDEVKAAAGYLAVGKAKARPAEVHKPLVTRLMVPVAVAASLVVAFFIGRQSGAKIQLQVQPETEYVSYVHGTKVTSEEFAVTSMETTLSDFFQAAPDVPAELGDIFANDNN